MDRTGDRGLSSRPGPRLVTVDGQAHHPLSSSAVIQPLRAETGACMAQHSTPSVKWSLSAA